MDTKICAKCKIDKPITEFSIEKKKGKSPCVRFRCKQCDSEYIKEYRIKNPDWATKKGTRKRKDPDRVWNVLSLGAGVQSSTVFLMSCMGILPRFDCAIFADTGWEPPAVYDHLGWLKEMGESHGVPVHVVSNGNIRKESLNNTKEYFINLPIFTKNNNNHMGIMKRQCTSHYKIEPIQNFLRVSLLNLEKGQHAPFEAINQFIGISIDELKRVRISRDTWVKNIYPLCNIPSDYLDNAMTRADCIAWLNKNFPDRKVPRSACIGCPFHSDKEWGNIKSDPVLWADAVDFDNQIRNSKISEGFEVFLHKSCVPLSEVKLDIINNSASWSGECEGMCGL